MRIQIAQDIQSLSRSSKNSRGLIDPANTTNPYDEYGESYLTLLENFDENSYIIDGPMSDFITDYINENKSQLNIDTSDLNRENISAVGSNVDLYSNYSSIEIINELYTEGQITLNVKTLLLDFESQVEYAESSTYNNIAKTYENNIVESNDLLFSEKEILLTTISIAKYDNAFASNPARTGKKNRCIEKAAGGAIIGFLACGGGCSILGGFWGWFSCEILGAN